MSNLKVIPAQCIACGKCYLNFPNVFDCTDDGIAFVKEDSTSADREDSFKAIYECPTRAIVLDEPVENY